MVKKKIKDLTLKEATEICLNQNACEECPFYDKECDECAGFLPVDRNFLEREVENNESDFN